MMHGSPNLPKEQNSAVSGLQLHLLPYMKNYGAFLSKKGKPERPLI
jgi:hypothetical protein